MSVVIQRGPLHPFSCFGCHECRESVRCFAGFLERGRLEYLETWALARHDMEFRSMFENSAFVFEGRTVLI